MKKNEKFGKKKWRKLKIKVKIDVQKNQKWRNGENGESFV